MCEYFCTHAIMQFFFGKKLKKLFAPSIFVGVKFFSQGLNVNIFEKTLKAGKNLSFS